MGISPRGSGLVPHPDELLRAIVAELRALRRVAPAPFPSAASGA